MTLHTNQQLLLHALLIANCFLTVHGISSDQGPESPSSSLSHGQGLLAGAVAGFGSLLLLGIVALTCMDCMNSEVSSESHPASGGSNPKWGGASNYQRAGCGEGYVSEVVEPSQLQNAPLPYSMIPTQIPENAEFRGYQSGGVSGGMDGYNAAPPPQSSSNVAGYNAYNAYNSTTNQNTGLSGFATENSGGRDSGRHFQPVEYDPPPAYNEAANSY